MSWSFVALAISLSVEIRLKAAKKVPGLNIFTSLKSAFAMSLLRHLGPSPCEAT